MLVQDFMDFEKHTSLHWAAYEVLECLEHFFFFDLISHSHKKGSPRLRALSIGNQSGP